MVWALCNCVNTEVAAVAAAPAMRCHRRCGWFASMLISFTLTSSQWSNCVRQSYFMQISSGRHLLPNNQKKKNKKHLHVSSVWVLVRTSISIANDFNARQKHKNRNNFQWKMIRFQRNELIRRHTSLKFQNNWVCFAFEWAQLHDKWLDWMEFSYFICKIRFSIYITHQHTFVHAESRDMNMRWDCATTNQSSPSPRQHCNRWEDGPWSGV